MGVQIPVTPSGAQLAMALSACGLALTQYPQEQRGSQKIERSGHQDVLWGHRPYPHRLRSSRGDRNN